MSLDRKKKLTGNCEDDCQEQCAYPGQFSECDLGTDREDGGQDE